MVVSEFASQKSSRWSFYTLRVQISPDAENGLTKTSAADTFQIRSVPTSRFVRKIGKLSPIDLNAIIEALALVVEIPPIN